MSGAVVAWIVAVVVVSGVALIAWWKLARPDVSDLTLASELRHAVARPVILAAALVRWSALNAVAEEFFFRGALQCTLTQSLGPALGIVVQAAVFGLIHYRGFPRGWSGIALATIYGLMLGRSADEQGACSHRGCPRAVISRGSANTWSPVSLAG
jgi:hypothetical protein